jgi:hypothetical protein
MLCTGSQLDPHLARAGLCSSAILDTARIFHTETQRHREGSCIDSLCLCVSEVKGIEHEESSGTGEFTC